MKKIIFILSFVLFFDVYAYDFLDITKFGYEQYQDIVINGKVVKEATRKHGKRDCEGRFEIIDENVLSRYTRSFTMLDIGASQGYYSLRAANKYSDSVFVMIEGNNRHYPKIGDQILSICKCNTELDNIILLNKQIVVKDLKRLGECEYFDVILLLNIAHWFGDQWKDLLDYVIRMGDNIIIENPPQEPAIASKQSNQLRKKIEDYVLSKGAKIIGKVKRHTSNTFSNVYLLKNDKDYYLTRKTWLMPKLKRKSHCISSNFKKKIFFKEIDHRSGLIMKSDWLSGINLITFKMYNGSYPSNELIKENMIQLSSFPSNDWMPNNMIIQGVKLVMVDTDDPNRCTIFEKYKLKKILNLLDINDPKEFKKFFWENLIGVSRRPLFN